MERVRRRVNDPKVNRLIVAFLKAGVLLSTIGGVRADLTKPRAGRLPGSSPSTVALTRWSARAALVFSGLRSELIGVATSSS
jgi:hypothetical protein